MVLIAVAQFCATPDPLENLSTITRIIKHASQSGAKILFLPEASDYISRTPHESLSLSTSPSTQAFHSSLPLLASSHNLDICVGVHLPSSLYPPGSTWSPLPSPPAPSMSSSTTTTITPTESKLYNTLLYLPSLGPPYYRYDKLHLFDYPPNFLESATTLPGTILPPPIPTPAGPLGLQICFDIRFPEPLVRLRRQGTELVCYPAAFAEKTGGRGDWSTLVRARAVEGQVWAVGAAQVGCHWEEGGKGRRSWGEGMCVAPDGEIRWKGKTVREGDGVGNRDWEGLGEWVEVGLVEVGEEGEEVGRVRGEMELKRREDVYGEI